MITTHTDDFSRRGEPDAFLKARRFVETRFGKLKVQQKSSVRAGVETGPGGGFLCDGDPGGLYEEPETPPHLYGNAGRPQESPVGG